MAEYASMFAVSGIATALFLGGWHSGIGLEKAVLEPLRARGGAGFLMSNIIAASIFITKGCLLVFVQMWVRWTLPRLRIDQVMTTCLKYLLPISCFLFLGITVWPLLIHQFTGRTTLLDSVNVLGSELGVPKANQAFRPELVPPVNVGESGTGAEKGSEAKVDIQPDEEQAGQVPNRDAVQEGQVQS
jgi:hypothetical protein